MKAALVFAMYAFCGIASAQTPDLTQPTDPTTNKQQRFDAAKNKRLAKIGVRLERLQKLQSCVQAATNFAGLRACRPAPAAEK